MIEAQEQLYRLLARFEQGPIKVNGVAWPRTPEGAALRAYLCPAGKWTIAFGCTKHPDGTPIREGDTITPDQVYPYTAAAVARVLSDISRMVTRPLNKYQLAALGSFVFNLGGENLRTSPRLLPAINAGRWEDAADIMGDYYRAWGKKDHIEDGVKVQKWHRMAMFGLRIRRAAEGCVLLGLDWPEACDPENISFPKKTEWQPNWADSIRTGGRYFDVVQPEATPVSVIHHLAMSNPLPPLDASPVPADAPAAILFPTEPARIEAPVASLPDSPAAIPLDTIPTQLPLPDPIEDELFLDTPAATEETSVSKGSPPVSEPPSPASQAAVPSQPNSSSSKLESPAPVPKAPQSPPGPVSSLPPLPKPSNVPAPRTFDPPVIAGQGGLKPMHPETKMPDMIPYRIDPNAGAKPLESTERFLGSVFILLGTLTRTAMANGFKLSGAGGVIVAWILTLMKDPVHFAIFVAFVAMALTGAGWLFGVCLQKFGVKKKRKGEAGSSQLMY